MSRRRHKRHREHADVELTTFLNMLVVLIAFLLVSAVFSRITIQELKLPAAAGGAAAKNAPPVTIEVILRKDSLQIGNGRSLIAAIPNSGNQYDIPKLSELLQKLKDQYKDKTDATLLVEPEIAYEDVIHVMDAMKVTVVPDPGQPEPKRIELFPDVSMGDAP
jgi:biopolymer transport protein ExbD